MTKEAREGIRPHIQRLLQQGILVKCQSPWNTPLLPVKKPGTGDYRPVQDLREVNKRVQDIHPTVPNPYNLLSSLPPDHIWYTVLDLKDAFFCLRLHPSSQNIFAFEWRDPDSGTTGQLTWTRLPQGFKNSPTLFDEALHQDLTHFRASHPQVTLLQYVDDLLLAGATEEECQRGTGLLLEELAHLGYRASAKKAQICQREVTYLGYTLKGGQRWLTEARKQTVTQIPVPRSPRQVREFLGTAGFCRLWIPGFATLAAPLYPLTRESAPFEWGNGQQQAFDDIKKALLSAPALALPDAAKPFVLFVDKRRGVARGVLTQPLGPWKRPVAYLSKKLDPVASGWPACLRSVAAVAVLVKDADKLTMGQKLTVIAPHSLESIIRQPPDRWLSNARMTHYQSLLLNEDRIQFGPPAILNPATLLPETSTQESVLHTCQEILAEETGTRRDLRDQPLPDAQLTWFTDGSSYIIEGKRVAGAAVVDNEQIIWASSLPEGTSAQKAELLALTQALRLAEGKKINIYTDSRYAFATAHVHGAIYRQRGLLTSAGKEIKNKEEILSLLEAVHLPKKVAIIHCPGHQKRGTRVAEGNQRADREAKQAAQGLNILSLSEKKPKSHPEDAIYPSIRSFEYSEPDLERMDRLGFHLETPEGIRETSEGKRILPEKQAIIFLRHLHKLTHLGPKHLKTIVQSSPYYIMKLGELADTTVKECKPCQMVNAQPSKLTQGKRLRGDRPGSYWEIDFTEVKPARYGYRYLLVFIDTFSGWVEAFPTKKETAQVVAKTILEDIFPRFGVPKVFSRTGDIIWSSTKEAPLWAWWPSLTPDICALVAGLENWDIPSYSFKEVRNPRPLDAGGSNSKLTLTEVSGHGTCLGTVPTNRRYLCNRTIESPQTTANYYLVPPVGGWWACSTGLTPCVSSSVFNTAKDYCVLVQLVPRVIYHEAGSFEAEFNLRPRKQKREPISLTLAALLSLGVAAGVGTGAAALVQTPQYIEGLRAAVNEDLKDIEQSITKLEESLTSLSEVVLQNRRGLDLLFLKDGGLCAALKEECCFYIDHSGVIKDSMSKLRERLETRQRDREAHQGWFESWYNRSPWFTTLISTLMGPLIILLLILTFGPCILNRLVTFVRERISAVQVLMLRQHYQSLRQGDSLGEGYVETEVP
ncbi:hypothetical protein QTO34_008611 [Cnephaeus nilssonii]|uniref:Uncharacterized protein n=1 Tax=Cnephaeus nilssonii TaxID=3371016 RepID=A0AA40LWG4_CNENI|nr:hypothetical protein QTO34_008611 [Eptesicus nilssonii]